jgi:hypothetical protein
MYLEKIICNQLNTLKYLKATFSQLGKIEIEYRLSVPSWCNDRKYLGTDEKRAVIYSRNKKYNNPGVKVNFRNYNELNNSHVSRNKFYTERYTYSVIDLIGKDLTDMFYKEYLNVFRELKSNILLEKIGDLSKQWDTLTSGKDVIVNEARIPYVYPIQSLDTIPF